MDILALHRQGHSMHSIAKRLGLHGLRLNSVKKYVPQRRISEYRRANGRNSILAPFVPIIQDRLSQDNYRASWIFQGLKQIGFEGGYDTYEPGSNLGRAWALTSE